MYLVIEKGILFFPLLLQLKAIETGVISLIVYIKIFVFRKSPCIMQNFRFIERFSKLIQLNLHENDLLQWTLITVNNLSLVNIFGETGRLFYNINYMLNSKHLLLVNKIGDKTKFTITRVHTPL